MELTELLPSDANSRALLTLDEVYKKYAKNNSTQEDVIALRGLSLSVRGGKAI